MKKEKMKKNKYKQSAYVWSILKDVIREFDQEFSHINIHDLFVMRVDYSLGNKAATITKTSEEFQKTVGPIFLIKVSSKFDGLLETFQKRELFHVLCAIPMDYRESKRLIEPDVIAYNLESIFIEKYKNDYALQNK